MTSQEEIDRLFKEYEEQLRRIELWKAEARFAQACAKTAKDRATELGRKIAALDLGPEEEAAVNSRARQLVEEFGEGVGP